MSLDLSNSAFTAATINPIPAPNYNADAHAAANDAARAQDDSFRTIVFARLAAERAADGTARAKNSDDRDKKREADAGKQVAPSTLRSSQKTDDATKAQQSTEQATADTEEASPTTSTIATDESALSLDVATPALAADTTQTTIATPPLNAVISTLAALVKANITTAKATPTTTDNAQAATPEPALDGESLQKLQTLLSNLLNGTPAAQDDTAQLTPAQTAAANAQLASPSTLKNVSAALIAAGLSPEKLAALVAQLKKKTSTEDGTGSTNSLVAAVVQLVTPAVKRDTLFTTGTGTLGLQTAKPAAADAGAAKPAAAKDGEIAQTQLDPLMTGSNDDASAAGAPSQGFDNILKIFEAAQTQFGGTKPAFGGAHPSTPAPTGTKTEATISPALSTVPGTVATPPATGMNFASNLSGQVYPDGLDWSKDTTDATSVAGAAQSISLTGPALSTSLVINVAQSSNPHPTTQIVASTLIKTALDGESKDITLHLDPAELGKVEVQMRIDKDQTVKAHLVVEKPETYLMLQRDSHVLQRALNDAGLSAHGNSLSFELGQGGTQQQNNNGNGQNGRSGTNFANENDAVTETTMNWSINSATGQTHYNIFA